MNLEHLRSIYHSTYAILFMGTPHHGIEKNSLLFSRLSKHPGPSQFLLSLLEGSETLQEITDQFAPLMKKFLIYNFWEQIETRAGGTTAYVVGQKSAAPGWDVVDQCGIMATHSGMVKFSNKVDQGYKVVLAALKRYIESAPRIIRSRWEHESELLYKERVQEAQTLIQDDVHAVLHHEAQNLHHEAQALIQYEKQDPLQHKTQALLQRVVQVLLQEVQVVLQQEKQSPLQLHPTSDVQYDDASAYVNVHYEVRRCSNSYFTGRQVQADYMKEKLGPIQERLTGTKHKIFVIHGLGGSGKTQFCLKYLEDNRYRYDTLTCRLRLVLICLQ
jgi:hypothetical protein